MAISDSKQTDVENIGRELSSEFQGKLKWKWDKRFETVLAEFPVNDTDKIRAVLERHLNNIFDSSNVGNGPSLVRAVDDHFGGMRRGQLLFTSDPNRAALVYCSWWPWGDGKSISIRIGAEYENLSDSEHTEKMKLFKSGFGV
jgi:hypothetical protein